MTIQLLTRDDARSWQYIPGVCQRIIEFCRKYDSDADPEALARLYQYHFLADEPKMLAYVLLSPPENTIEGHLLASIDTWMGCTICQVLQYEKDSHARVPIDLLQATFARVATWGKAHGAVHFQVLVRNPLMGRAIKRFYKFSPFAAIFRAPL